MTLSELFMLTVFVGLVIIVSVAIENRKRDDE
jgi:hypothetical protein